MKTLTWGGSRLLFFLHMNFLSRLNTQNMRPVKQKRCNENAFASHVNCPRTKSYKIKWRFPTSSRFRCDSWTVITHKPLGLCSKNSCGEHATVVPGLGYTNIGHRFASLRSATCLRWCARWRNCSLCADLDSTGFRYTNIGHRFASLRSAACVRGCECWPPI